MSHFSVAVFTEKDGRDIDELLAPYYECLEVPHYHTKEEIISNVRRKIEEYKNGRYQEYLKNPEEYILKCKNDSHAKYISEEFPKKLTWTDEQCYQDGIKYEDACNIKEDGSVFDRYNPNAKWDWYEIGGRFSNTIPLNDGTFSSSANINDVAILKSDTKQYDDAIRFWQIYIQGDEPRSEEERMLASSYYKREYYTERYKDAEDYANYVSGFHFYAALLPNGEWYEPGEMGWFGISSACAEDDIKWRKTQEDILDMAFKNGWDITIVDCHI